MCHAGSCTSTCPRDLAISAWRGMGVYNKRLRFSFILIFLAKTIKDTRTPGIPLENICFGSCSRKILRKHQYCTRLRPWRTINIHATYYIARVASVLRDSLLIVMFRACVLHIKLLFPPIDIHHPQSPCRFLVPERASSVVKTFEITRIANAAR